MPVQTLIWLIPVPPLIAFAAIILGGGRSRSLSHSLAVGAAGLSWLASMVVCWQAATTKDLAANVPGSAYNWLPVGAGWLTIGARIDPLSAVTLFFVAWTILCIFIYSIGYHNFGAPAGVHDKPGLPPHGALKTTADGRSIHIPSVEPMYSPLLRLHLPVRLCHVCAGGQRQPVDPLYRLGDHGVVFLPADRVLVCQTIRP